VPENHNHLREEDAMRKRGLHSCVFMLSLFFTMLCGFCFFGEPSENMVDLCSTLLQVTLFCVLITICGACILLMCRYTEKVTPSKAETDFSTLGAICRLPEGVCSNERMREIIKNPNILDPKSLGNEELKRKVEKYFDEFLRHGKKL